MCACNFLEEMRCEWDVLWHHKASVCWTLSVRVAGVCHWLHLSPLGEQNNIQREGEEENMLKRSEGASILFSSFLGGRGVYPWVVLSCTVMVHHPGSTGRFWCLMWSEVDHIWGKAESDTLVLQLSQERNESVASLCVRVSAQWKMAGKKHVWHTGAPVHIQLKVFFWGGLVTF